MPVVNEPVKEDNKMDTDGQPGAAPPAAGEIDINMQDAKGTADGDASSVENGVAESEKPAQMETDTKVSCCFLKNSSSPPVCHPEYTMSWFL